MWFALGYALGTKGQPSTPTTPQQAQAILLGVVIGLIIVAAIILIGRRRGDETP